MSLSLGACSTFNSLMGNSGPQPGQVGYVQGFLGAVVADEPLAALAGREVLSTGGNAADAAVAVGLVLSVTLPSRAGIGGGGACLAYATGKKSVNGGAPEAIMFPPAAPPSGSASGDRPVALPMTARGLFLLHARYGSRPFETYVATAEQMARFGVGVSRALVRDLQVVGPALLADPPAASVFAPGGQMLREGESLRQPELGGTLAVLRTSGVGDMYLGATAKRLVDVAPRIGASLTEADLRAAIPRMTQATLVPYRNDIAAFLPVPADGGLAAAAAFKVLAANPNAVDQANNRALAVAAAWRSGAGNPEGLLNSEVTSDYPLPALPASTSFVVMDKDGNAVTCALTMNNLFGTGRMYPTTGVMAAASPAVVPPPLLSAGLVFNQNVSAFRAAAGGSGQQGAPLAVALGLMNTLRTYEPMPTQVPEPGRLNIIACGRYLPSENRSCAWANDPRDFGLAVGGT